jgi:hypothetical protein
MTIIMKAMRLGHAALFLMGFMHLGLAAADLKEIKAVLK